MYLSFVKQKEKKGYYDIFVDSSEVGQLVMAANVDEKRKYVLFM